MKVKLGDTTYKTDVYRKSLNPAWNSEWFRYIPRAGRLILLVGLYGTLNVTEYELRL